MLILATHVDDLIWARKPLAEGMFAKNKGLFTFGTEGVHSFPNCGKEVTQDLGTLSIKAARRATLEKLAEIKLPPDRLQNFQLLRRIQKIRRDRALRLGFSRGSLDHARPLSYNVSKLQGRSQNPLVDDLKTCNTRIRYALVTSDDGICFHHGLDRNNLVIGYVGNASFDEDDQPNEF